jgi:hypothetical protein
VDAAAGAVVCIETPGGGGHGPSDLEPPTPGTPLPHEASHAD